MSIAISSSAAVKEEEDDDWKMALVFDVRKNLMMANHYYMDITRGAEILPAIGVRVGKHGLQQEMDIDHAIHQSRVASIGIEIMFQWNINNNNRWMEAGR